MQAVALPLQQFISNVKDNVNAFVFGVLIFSYQALETGFPCSCKPQRLYCCAYMAMPCLIVIALMLSTDPQFQKAWRYMCSKGSCHFGCVLFRRTIKAVCVGLLWVASVLIDAEWSVCCNNPNPRAVAALQCKNKTDITAVGLRLVTIAEMKVNSQMIGMSLLFGIVFVGAILLSAWSLCAGDRLCRKWCSREDEVDELFLEVGDEIVSDAMKGELKEQLSKMAKDNIKNKEWVKCLDIVAEAIRQKKNQDKSDSHEMNPVKGSTTVTGSAADSLPTNPQHSDRPDHQ